MHDSLYFKALWNKIKQKTTYRVRIDTDELVRRSFKALQDMPHIPKARIISQTADIQIQNDGVTHTKRELRTFEIQNDHTRLPDVLAVLCEETNTPEPVIFDVLTKSGRLGEFINNPQLFIENTTQIIRDNRHALAIDGIRYEKLAGLEY